MKVTPYDEDTVNAKRKAREASSKGARAYWDKWRAEKERQRAEKARFVEIQLAEIGLKAAPLHVWQTLSSNMVTKAPNPPPITVRVEQVEPLYVNKKQLAQSLVVSERTIDNWRERSVIPFLKIKGVIRFNLADIRTALERRFGVREKSVPAKRFQG